MEALVSLCEAFVGMVGVARKAALPLLSMMGEAANRRVNFLSISMQNLMLWIHMGAAHLVPQV